MVVRRHGSNYAVIAAIIAVAIALSLILFQYSQYSSTQIQEISTRNIRTNAEIQAMDLGNSLANKIGDVTSLLQVIAAAPSVSEKDVGRASTIFNHAQLATADLVEFYMWLDEDGRIVWISNLNQTTYDQYRGLDLSYRLYFSEPKATESVYYSSIVDSNDRINRLYIAHPILSGGTQVGSPFAAPTIGNVTEFEGLVAAGVRTEALGDYLESQISPNLKGQVGITDHTGIILHSRESEHVGKNVFGVKYQSYLQSFGSDTARAVNAAFSDALDGSSGSTDVLIGEESALVYAPVMVDGVQFGVLYMIAPYSEAAEVTALIETQKNLSVMLIVSIGISAVTAAIVVLRQNKVLEKTIEHRTAQLRAANEQLTVHDRLQREFINIAAHELRTPVQPILGMSELLESELGDRREEIRLIARNAKRLERLTQDILDASKIESGSLTLSKQKIDLDSVISSIIIDYRDRPSKTAENPEQKGVKIKYEPMHVLVEADAGRIQQVMANLIGNALKFTGSGEITVKTEVVDGSARVSVRDSGSGIDPDIRSRLFQKFATRSEKGTGLGLYISNSIVQAHGGRMWAEDNGDEPGATFYFTLPIALN